MNSRRYPWATWILRTRRRSVEAVVGSGESVAAVAGKTVVVVVAVLVGIAVDGGVDGAPAAGGDDAGNFPVVENVAEEFVFAVEGPRLHRERGDEAVALVSDAGATLGVGIVGILHGRGFAGDQRVLAVVDGVGVGVGEAEIGAAGHAAVDGESCAVVDAGGGALKFVDRAQLGDGASQRIDAGRERAGQRLRVLPGGEGIDGVVSALKNRARGIEERISERDRRREIHIERADEMFAVDVEIRDRDGGVAGDFALESEAGLLHARSHEVGSERGDVVGDALGESGGKIARSGGRERATEPAGWDKWERLDGRNSWMLLRKT